MTACASLRELGTKTGVKTGAMLASFALAMAAILVWSPVVASEARKDSDGALATIEVSASKEVLQDEVRVVFGTQASGSTAADVNRKLSDTLKQARADFAMPEGVAVSTGNFSVYLQYGKDNKPAGWAGRAGLVVDSQNLESVSAVIEHLGKSLAISSVQFSLSRQARQEHEKSLMQDLAQELAQRAGLAAQAFGFKHYEIVALDFAGGGNSRPVMQRMAAPMSDAAGPSVSLEPSMTTVEISVTGQIRLH